MAYIISVNANITSSTGGTCVCPAESLSDNCATNSEYLLCVQEVKRDMVTATAAIASLSTFSMGLFANLPIALAPGMGLNAYFAYTVVGKHGAGLIPYSVALTAVFVEGWVFFGLTLIGMRQWLARALPASIKLATGVGIGLYLALIGLTYDAGIGLVQGGVDTPIELAGCTKEAQYLDEDGLCLSSAKMRSPTMWIGIFCGGFLTAFLMMYRVKGAVIIGILLVSIISWPRTTPVTYFPYTDLGTSMFDFFKQVVTFHPIKHTLAAQQWDISGHGSQFGLAFITFLYVDILDTTGTMYSMARFAGAIDERTQDFEGSAVAYVCFTLTPIKPLTTLINYADGRRNLHFNRVSSRNSPSNSICRIRCWNFRRRKNRPNILHDGHCILHRCLLRSDICFHSGMGDGLYARDCRCAHGQICRRYQLAILR